MLAEAFPRLAEAAPVQVIEFLDLECPACRKYAGVLTSIQKEFGSKLTIQYVHFPLAYHGNAMAAAEAAACADHQARGAEFIQAALERQPEFGTMSWSAIGAVAGVPDTLAFRACVDHHSTSSTVEEGLLLGRRFGVTATPTLLVNGWRFEQVPGRKQLSRFIRDVLAGRVPPPALQPTSGGRYPARYREGEQQILVYDSVTINGAQAWELLGDALAEVGGADDLINLDDAREFVILSDGRFVAASPRGPSLWLFSAAGTQSQLLGRSGSGPGEWRGIAGLRRGGADSIVFVDPANLRLNVISAADLGVRTESLANRVPAGVYHLAGILPNGAIVVDGLGRLPFQAQLGKGRSQAPIVVSQPGDTGRRVLLVPDVDFEVVKTLYGGRPDVEPVPIGYGARTFVVTVGDRIVVGTGPEPRVDLYDANGQAVRSLRFKLPRQGVSPAARAAEKDRRLDELAGYREQPIDPAESRRLIREMPFADSLPAFADIFVSPSGTMWLVDAHTTGAESWRATAIRSDGAVLARLRAATEDQPVAFGDDRVLLRHVDTDGLVSLRMVRIGPLD
jgi:hypothetical protein